MNNTIILNSDKTDFKVKPLGYNTKISRMYDIISMFKSIINVTANPFEIAVLTRMLAEQLYVIQSQPIVSKYYKKGGIAVVNIGCECEYYETPDGTKYKTKECEYCKTNK